MVGFEELAEAAVAALMALRTASLSRGDRDRLTSRAMQSMGGAQKWSYAWFFST